ncbi:hypothetical protein B566_EDAN017615 [Ephemera danica]|nr:hypothetical protein B566_EDAN017615 [Ephemera danica]
METKVESELLRISDRSKISFETVLKDQLKYSKLVKIFKKVALEHQEIEIKDFTENTKFGDTDRINELHETLKQDTEKIYKDHEAKLLEEHPIQNRFASIRVSSATGAAIGLTAGTVAVASETTFQAAAAAVVQTLGTAGTTALVVGGTAVGGAVAIATGGVAIAVVSTC